MSMLVVVEIGKNTGKKIYLFALRIPGLFMGSLYGSKHLTFLDAN